MQEKFYLFKKQLIRISRETDDDLWRDDSGCVYAMYDARSSVDKKVAAGVGPFTLPDWKCFKEVNRAAGVHDYMYSCPAYQLYNTREEADRALLDLLRQTTKGSWTDVLPRPFYCLARAFGWLFWENNKTK